VTLRANIRHASLLVHSVGRTTDAPEERGIGTHLGILIDMFVASFLKNIIRFTQNNTANGDQVPSRLSFRMQGGILVNG